MMLSVAGIASSCSKSVDPPVDDGPGNVSPEPEPEPEPESEKPVVLWIDAEANFGRLATRTGITSVLDKAVETGFNTIVVDVKPVQGEVLYDSDFLHPCTSLGGSVVSDRGFDYLQFFIDEARARKMKVTVSTTIMTMGLPQSKTGPAYYDPYWDDKFCVEYLPDADNLPSGYLKDIRESDAWDVFAFLNPVLPEVKEYVLKMVREVVSKYDFDGYALDYCRYMNLNSDFSDASKAAFEKYSGITVENFPADIYTFNSVDKSDIVPGKYYNEWIEWRSSVIQGYVRDIRNVVKSLKPDVNLEYWAASWWPLPHTGQNWASPRLDSTWQYWWATPDYYKTGFADQLDIFQLGAYLEVVYGKDDPVSVEYAINKAKGLLAGDCTLYGTIQCADRNFDIENAVYLCLMQTSGVMVFELSHIINNDKWDEIKSGIERAEKEMYGEK